MKTAFFLVLGFLFSFGLHSQDKPPLSLVPVREADIMWAREIWRVIDIRDQLNYPFYFPLERTAKHVNLFQVMLDGIRKDKIKAYYSDELADTLSKKNLFSRIVKNDSIDLYSYDEFGREYVRRNQRHDTLQGEYILQYWIKELWFFDSKRSIMDVRIEAICPVKIDEEKELLIPLFWIDYQNSREWLNSYTAINSKNINEQRTFDELFIKRRFETTIKKESNIFDREITDYVENDKQALSESERIKEYLRNFECDRWEY